VNKISSESTAQDDDFQEVKRWKRYMCTDTWETAKKLTKSVPVSTAAEQITKAMPTCNFFTPLRTNDMDTETNEAENTLLEQEIR
jgi:hypothetical protein